MVSLSEWLDQPGELFRRVIDELDNYAIFLIDPAGRVATWNEGAARLFGYEESEIVGRPVDVLFTAADRADGEATGEMDLADSDGTAPDERWHLRRDGSRFWASGHMRAIRDDHDQLIGYMKIVRDLTERKEHEHQLHARLRELALRLTRTEQRERQQLAADLHSTLAQDLVSCRIKLNLAKRHASDSAREHCDEIDGLLARSIHYVRTLIATLSPVHLRSMPLGEALHRLAEQIEQDRGLRVRVDAPNERLPIVDELRVLVFQAAHELLTNVAKHAGVEEAELTMWTDAQQAHLRVTDRGRGVEPRARADARDSGAGFGLADVEARIATLGGRVDIDSAPGRGTTVTLSVPLDQSAQAA